MVLAKEIKEELKKKFGIREGDSGSAPVQVALITGRINYLVEHLKTHKKDQKARRGLLLLVSQRKKLLKYVERVDYSRYEQLVKDLGL